MVETKGIGLLLKAHPRPGNAESPKNHARIAAHAVKPYPLETLANIRIRVAIPLKRCSRIAQADLSRAYC